MQDLEHQGRLNLIIFDEIHKVLTDHSYRNVFLEFWVLNLVKTAIVGLDGSLPPECIPEFFSLTNTSWRVIRTPSNRPELGYEIRQGNPIEDIAKDIPQLTATYEKDDRLMVFCRTHADLEKLSASVKVPAFSSHTVDKNKETMEMWIQGERKVMISTSILGCGLDYPSVRHVLHFGIAHSMIDQHQQESRAGRDGKSAMAITYVSANQRQSSNSSSGYGRQELERWARNVHQCLRIIQSQYLDGVAVTCSLLPACTLCAYCAEQLHQDPPAQPQRLPHAQSSSTIPFQPTPLPPVLPPVFTKVTSIPKQPSLEDALPSMMDGFPDSEPMYSDPIFTQT